MGRVKLSDITLGDNAIHNYLNNKIDSNLINSAELDHSVDTGELTLILKNIKNEPICTATVDLPTEDIIRGAEIVEVANIKYIRFERSNYDPANPEPDTYFDCNIQEIYTLINNEYNRATEAERGLNTRINSINDSINAMDYSFDAGAARSKTIIKLTQEDGKITDVTSADILLNKSQVNNLESDLSTINNTISSLTAEVNKKADKVVNATMNNFASLNTDGSLKDSGSKASDFATAAQGALADSAIQSVVEGATNGTIAVDGSDVSVHGLGSAAFTDSAAYDPAGTANSEVTAHNNNNSAHAELFNKKVDKNINSAAGIHKVINDQNASAVKFEGDAVTSGMAVYAGTSDGNSTLPQGEGINGQIYSVKNTDKSGTRINIYQNKITYSNNAENQISDDTELAVKKDIAEKIQWSDGSAEKVAATIGNLAKYGNIDTINKVGNTVNISPTNAQSNQWYHFGEIALNNASTFNNISFTVKKITGTSTVRTIAVSVSAKSASEEYFTAKVIQDVLIDGISAPEAIQTNIYNNGTAAKITLNGFVPREIQLIFSENLGLTPTLLNVAPNIGVDDTWGNQDYPATIAISDIGYIFENTINFPTTNVKIGTLFENGKEGKLYQCTGKVNNTFVWTEIQTKIDTDSKLSADLINDSNSTNKFVSTTEKLQITTNANNISALQSNKLATKPDGTTDLIDNNNKINVPYLPDFVLGNMMNAGTITSLDNTTATATLTDGGKARLGITDNSIVLTNDTAAITGYITNENNYYIIADNTGVKDGEILREDYLNLLKNTMTLPATYHDVDFTRGDKTGSIVVDGTAEGTSSNAYNKKVADISFKANHTYVMYLYSGNQAMSNYCVALVRGYNSEEWKAGDSEYERKYAQTSSNGYVKFTALIDIDCEVDLFFYGSMVYDDFTIYPAIYEVPDGEDITISNMPEYQPYLSTFAGLYFEAGDWLVATASGWGKIDNVDAVKAVNGKTGYIQLTIADIPNLQGNLDTKADKVSGATNGHLAGLDATGNLTDSGKSANDFATASQGIKADTAIQPEDLNSYQTKTDNNLATTNKTIVGAINELNTNKADDNAVVKLTGDQTINGQKTFAKNLATNDLLVVTNSENTMLSDFSGVAIRTGYNNVGLKGLWNWLGSGRTGSPVEWSFTVLFPEDKPHLIVTNDKPIAVSNLSYSSGHIYTVNYQDFYLAVQSVLDPNETIEKFIFTHTYDEGSSTENWTLYKTSIDPNNEVYSDTYPYANSYVSHKGISLLANQRSGNVVDEPIYFIKEGNIEVTRGNFNSEYGELTINFEYDSSSVSVADYWYGRTSNNTHLDGRVTYDFTPTTKDYILVNCLYADGTVSPTTYDWIKYFEQLLTPQSSEQTQEISAVYGIVYDKDNDTVKLGLGTINSSGKFVEYAGATEDLATRDTDTNWIDGHLAKWNSKKWQFEDSGISKEDVDSKITNPTGGTAGQVLKKTASGVEWANDQSGAVDSVNGQTGTVVLDADDISDTNTTNKFVTASEKTNIAKIPDKQDKLNQYVDLSHSQLALQLVTNTHYLLGTIQKLSLTFPNSATAGDKILIQFNTASSFILEKDVINALYDFQTLKTNNKVLLLAEYNEVWIVKASLIGTPITLSMASNSIVGKISTNAINYNGSSIVPLGSELNIQDNCASTNGLIGYAIPNPDFNEDSTQYVFAYWDNVSHIMLSNTNVAAHFKPMNTDKQPNDLVGYGTGFELHNSESTITTQGVVLPDTEYVIFHDNNPDTQKVSTVIFNGVYADNVFIAAYFSNITSHNAWGGLSVGFNVYAGSQTVNLFIQRISNTEGYNIWFVSPDYTVNTVVSIPQNKLSVIESAFNNGAMEIDLHVANDWYYIYVNGVFITKYNFSVSIADCTQSIGFAERVATDYKVEYIDLYM